MLEAWVDEMFISIDRRAALIYHAWWKNFCIRYPVFNALPPMR